MIFFFLQILLAVIALVYLATGIRHFLRREAKQTIFKLFFTLIVWGSVLLFSLFPTTGRHLSIAFGLGENLNTLIFIGFVAIFAILFKLLSILERLERSISDIVRAEALKRLPRQ